MSNPYALAAVSAVLRHRIRLQLTADDVAGAVGGTVDVTVGPPDRIKLDAPEPNTVNLFLHRATRNLGYSAAGLPTRDGNGSRVAVEPLALDLHYMVSAYGAAPFAPEILLGEALAALHDQPYLTSDVIRAALAPSDPDPSLPTALAGAGLAESMERLRITPSSPSIEDVTRLWSALSASYRPSAFFDVTVVIVESTPSTRQALPVLVTGTRADALDRPQVTDVQADGPPGTPVTAGATLVVSGTHLRGEGTTVVLGASTATPAHPRDTELRVPVADFDPPVRAGLGGLEVVRDVDLGDPPTAHAVYSSDAVPVIVRPTIALGAVHVDGTGTVAGVAVSTGTIPVTVDPPVTAAQRLSLMLNEIGAPVDRPARAFSLAPPNANGVPDGDADTADVTFAYATLPRGPYVVRLQVDGVESPLGQDGGGTFATPQVTL